MNNNISFNNIFNNSALKMQNSVGSLNTDEKTSFGDILSSGFNASGLNGGSSMDMSSLYTGLLSGENGSSDVMQLFFSMLGLGVDGDSSIVNSIADALSGVSLGDGSNSMENTQSFLKNRMNIPLPQMQNVVYGEDLNANLVKDIPVAGSKPSYPCITNNYTRRDPRTYRKVINQFDVENNDRYMPNKKGTNDTYCNIFTWDVTRAMGAEIPHYIDPDTYEPMYYPNTEGGVELSANSTFRWLEKVGEDYGWHKVTAPQAQALANQGRPAITAMKNTSGGSGHVQVVCPSMDGRYNENTGVAIAQAGSKRYNYTTLNNTTSNPSKFIYYAHI